MKIVIGEGESYDLKLNDTLTLQELNEVVYKLQSIQKVFGKYNLMSSTSISPEIKNTKVRKTRGKGIKLSREDVIKGLKLMYFGSKESKKEAEKESGISWNALVWRLKYYKKHSNITPKEVGLTRFPVRGEGAGDTIMKLKLTKEKNV